MVNEVTLDEKIAQSKASLKQILKNYDHPIVASSFGKDSMVMLDLIKKMGLKLPVLFHREPFFPKKHAFANGIIEREGYDVYDYAPSQTSVVKNGKEMEIINHYQVGPKKFSYLPTGIKEPKTGERFLCGLRDIYLKPVGSFYFPWRLVLVGHKSVDHCPILGDIPLSVEVKQNVGGPDYFFPLRQFTDEDIWAYSERFSVPQNLRRYDKNNGYREFEDITWNNDYYPACVGCIDRDEGASVFCPKSNAQVSNISSEIRYIEPLRPTYIGESK